MISVQNSAIPHTTAQGLIDLNLTSPNGSNIYKHRSPIGHHHHTANSNQQPAHTNPYRSTFVCTSTFTIVAFLQNSQNEPRVIISKYYARCICKKI